MLNSAEHEIFPVIYIKMPTIIVILILAVISTESVIIYEDDFKYVKNLLVYLSNLIRVSLFAIALLHSERPKLHTILAFLSAIGLTNCRSLEI